MVRELTCIAVVTLALSSANAQDAAPQIAPFISLCEVKQAVGFNWRSGVWVKVDFQLDRYIVKKRVTLSEGSQPDGSAVLCTKRAKPDPIEEADLSLRGGCYAITEPGKKEYYRWCQEMQSRRDGKWAVRYIACDNFGAEFNFTPNGPFTEASSAGVIDPKVPSKDSMSVGHGACSVIG